MADSSSGSRRYDVFPSFSGEDVRKTFLSHLRKELDRRLINTFMDHGIVRSRPIGPELLSAIRESRISIVIFSKNYASSTWCLNELVEIHKCYKDKELQQKVIPVFYDVDPSDVRKQTGTFGEAFKTTCKDKTEDVKQGWIRVLSEIASIAGEHLQNGPDEASIIEKIANDVSNKLVIKSNDFGDFVGIEAHLEAINSLLCWESHKAIMVGILGPSGIGKSTIGGALFSQLSNQFDARTFGTYKRTIQDDYGMKLSWEKQFLSEILYQKDINIKHIGEVKQRLKQKKVLIILDDVDELKLLETLVGKTEWFGPGSRIIVITQDRQLLKAHKIDVIYTVEFPSKALALEMLCQRASEKNSPPDGFMELAVEVAELAGNLPLGLSILGSYLKGRNKDEWVKMMPMLRNDLDGNIVKTLRVSYNRLDRKDRELFMYIACLFNGFEVSYVEEFFEDNVRLKSLADKSLIRITPTGYIEMHNLLEKLGREIDREESEGNLGKRRFLENAEEVLDVFTDKTGTTTMLGIHFNASQIKKRPVSIDENSFQGMLNLQYLNIHDNFTWWQPSETRLSLPNGLVYLPRKLKWLKWNYCPLKCLPCTFKAEYLIELRMEHSELEKLWEGTQVFGSLKKMIMRHSKYLKEIPDLSKAINLKIVDFYNCQELESFPTPLNSESLEYLNLLECPRLRNFPVILIQSLPHDYEIAVKDCLWNKNLSRIDYLDCLRRCNPSKFHPEHLKELTVNGNMLEKLWEGVHSLERLVEMDLSDCENLTEIPNLSKATNLEYLYLSNCKSLVRFPCTIRNLHELVVLKMEDCTGLEVFPVDVNLSSLQVLDLSGCSSLTSFPRISKRIVYLNLDDTAIEQVPCWVENLSKLTVLKMRDFKKLKNISPNIFRLTRLKLADFTNCGGLITALSDPTVEKRRTHDEDDDEDEDEDEGDINFNFQNCFELDGDARELILRSCFNFKTTMVLPGGEVPTYFEHRAYGKSITVILPHSSLSQEFLRFKACVVVEPLTHSSAFMDVHLHINGERYMHTIIEGMSLMCKTDHLVLCSFKLRSTHLLSKLEFNDVEFKFGWMMVKGCGVQLLNVSPSPDGSDGSSETK